MYVMGFSPLSIYSLNRLRKGGQRICLMVSVSISVGVAAISVMNICVSVKRKVTPLSTKSTKKNGDFTSVFRHREKSPFGQQKSPIDSGFSQETSILSPHSGGVGETRTLAPGFSRPTPLAGAPRHQLEYYSELLYVFTKLWRRGWDSNPCAFWANGFQDRLVMTASIPLRDFATLLFYHNQVYMSIIFLYFLNFPAYPY